MANNHDMIYAARRLSERRNSSVVQTSENWAKVMELVRQLHAGSITQIALPG
jgi:putative heme iron utilization protein